MGLRARIWLGLRTRSIWFDLGVALLGTVAVGIGSASPAGGVLPESLLLLGAAVLALLLFTLRRRAPLVPFLVSALLAAVSPVATAALLVTSYAVGRYVASWRVRVTAAVVGTVAASRVWAATSVLDAVAQLFSSALFVLAMGAIGAYLRARAELVVALRERAERAEAAQELLARDAVLTERTRIAREMHDAVGHRVSLMVLQAGAIEMAAGDRERVEQLAGQVQTAGRQALEELRQMVGVLRAGEESAPLAPQQGLADLPRLVEQAREAGMRIELAMNGGARVDPAVGRAAYRIVQEALTNGSKHAPGAPVTVVVEHPEGALVVRVVNGPPAPRPAAPPGGGSGGGYGLVGLAERVRTLGGRLTAEPRLDGGFRVEAELPT